MRTSDDVSAQGLRRFRKIADERQIEDVMRKSRHLSNYRRYEKGPRESVEEAFHDRADVMQIGAFDSGTSLSCPSQIKPARRPATGEFSCSAKICRATTKDRSDRIGWHSGPSRFRRRGAAMNSKSQVWNPNQTGCRASPCHQHQSQPLVHTIGNLRFRVFTNPHKTALKAMSVRNDSRNQAMSFSTNEGDALSTSSHNKPVYGAGAYREHPLQ